MYLPDDPTGHFSKLPINRKNYLSPISGHFLTEPSAAGARREKCTRDKCTLLTIPKAEGRPGPSDDDDDDNVGVSRPSANHAYCRRNILNFDWS